MIEIRPETENNLLVIQMTEKVTTQDYKEILIPRFEQHLQTHKKISTVVYLPSDFQGWELGAMWLDAKFGFQHKNEFDKIAIVGNQRWIRGLVKMAACLISGVVKLYGETELKTAIEWAKD
ncbi:MAG: STAS/SEC14 domain-containing protein [Methylococcales bacterium]|nr:STAS/SEC14 domain-containing protein [Methylococcales bacterium]